MAKTRSIVSGLKVELGLMSMTGDLFSLKKAGLAKEVGLKTVCPECTDEPQLVTQRYHCDNCQTTMLPRDTIKAKPTEQGLVFLAHDEIADTKESDTEKGELLLVPHKSDEVIQYPNGVAYCFVPAGDDPLYGILMELLKDSEYVLLGTIKIREEKLVRVVRNGRWLMIEELIRPEDVNDSLAPVDYSAETKYVAMGRTLIETLAEPFDPGNYRNQARDRMAQLVASKMEGILDGTIEAQPAPKERKQTMDLEAMLAASLAAAQASKAKVA